MPHIERLRCYALGLLLPIALVASYWTFSDYETIMVHKWISNHTVKRIAGWTTVFGEPAFREMLNEKDEINLNCSNRCTFHRAKGNPLTYDALIFHARDDQNKPRYRRPDQVYVIYVMESPSYPGNFYIAGDYYNWTATHDTRSDFWMPYVRFRKKQKPGFPPGFSPATLPQMKYIRKSDEAMVAWVVSNCHAASKREKYVNILQRSIKVDIFGYCGKRCFKDKVLEGHNCQKALAETGIYKFYLSFENSACRGYITEKVVHPLNTGLVPIVYGGLQHQEYVNLLPPHSFIDVRNFKSPKLLADYLLYLDRNDTAYMEYHAWRRDYEFGGGEDFLCWVCNGLYNQTMMRPHSVNWGQFWSEEANCDANLLDKVAG